MTRALAIFAIALTASAPAAAPEAVSGAILVQTARAGAMITPTGKDAKPQALKPGETLTAGGQLLDMQDKSPAALILSNGDSLYFPLGGRVTFDEFTQAPIADTSHNGREYEPSRSTVRLNMTQGTLAASGRKPVPTSTLALTTPLAQFNCLSPSFVALVETDSVTFILLEGTAAVTIPETGFHDTIQTGQSVTLTRQNLHANYPLKLANISTADNQKYAGWLASARTAEQRVTFTGAPGRLQPHTVIPQGFTQQSAVDDPRFRQ